MTEQQVQDWLDRYGTAWAQGEPDAVVVLFSESATYRETPFDKAMHGREQIRSYWQEGAADAQEDVEFSSQVWAVSDKTAAAGWQASFTRRASGVKVRLDGTFRLVFDFVHDDLQCTKLEEWWHRQEG